jgi:hypothetical protein
VTASAVSAGTDVATDLSIGQTAQGNHRSRQPADAQPSPAASRPGALEDAGTTSAPSPTITYRPIPTNSCPSRRPVPNQRTATQSPTARPASVAARRSEPPPTGRPVAPPVRAAARDRPCKRRYPGKQDIALAQPPDRISEHRLGTITGHPPSAPPAHSSNSTRACANSRSPHANLISSTAPTAVRRRWGYRSSHTDPQLQLAGHSATPPGTAVGSGKNTANHSAVGSCNANRDRLCSPRRRSINPRSTSSSKNTRSSSSRDGTRDTDRTRPPPHPARTRPAPAPTASTPPQNHAATPAKATSLSLSTTERNERTRGDTLPRHHHARRTATQGF